MAATAGGNSNFTSRDVLTQYPLIDGHNHFPDYVYQKLGNNLKTFDFNTTLVGSETDLPGLRTGLVGGQFWTAYSPCPSIFKDAVARTLEQIDVIKRIVKRYKDDLQLALSVDGNDNTNV